MKRVGRTRDAESAADRDELARFEAFYDFAFDRVYRFALRRMQSEARAQALCRLILFRALDSLGGIGVSSDLFSRVSSIKRPSAWF